MLGPGAVLGAVGAAWSKRGFPLASPGGPWLCPSPGRTICFLFQTFSSLFFAGPSSPTTALLGWVAGDWFGCGRDEQPRAETRARHPQQHGGAEGLISVPPPGQFLPPVPKPRRELLQWAVQRAPRHLHPSLLGDGALRPGSAPPGGGCSGQSPCAAAACGAHGVLEALDEALLGITLTLQQSQGWRRLRFWQTLSRGAWCFWGAAARADTRTSPLL